MHIPIMIDILEDFLSHTAGILGELMEGKRCLTGGDCSGIYDPFFCMPASQYIAVWKEGNIELWACDPNIEGLLQIRLQLNYIGYIISPKIHCEAHIKFIRPC